MGRDIGKRRKDIHEHQNSSNCGPSFGKYNKYIKHCSCSKGTNQQSNSVILTLSCTRNSPRVYSCTPILLSHNKKHTQQHGYISNISY